MSDYPQTLLTEPKLTYLLRELESVVMLNGSVSEFGVYAGGSAHIMAIFLSINAPGKRLHLFDSFAGLSAKGPMDGEEYLNCQGWYQGDYDDVCKRFAKLPDVVIHAGMFADLIAIDCDLCFAHLDCDLFESTCEAIRLVAPRLVPGGKIVLDDYNTTDWPGVRKAADRYLSIERFEKIQSSTTDQAVFTRKK